MAQFEDNFRVKHLYYARYTSLESSAVEISAFTEANWRAVEKFFLKNKGVLKVDIIDRSSGSLAHAYAYQAVKRIKPYEEDLAQDDAFLDVLHWFCNMRGLDYVREARAYTYASLRILHQTALETEKNFDAMRQFNADAKSRHLATSLIERLNLLGAKKPGKVRISAKAAVGGPQPPQKRSGRAAARKVPGSKHSRSSGSARR